MAKTTVDIDDRLLREIKALSRKEGVSMKEALERLVATGLSSLKQKPREKKLAWKSSPSIALINIQDKDALYKALDK